MVTTRSDIGALKEWRAVATRYEKTTASFLGVLCLAAAADWLRR
jgi:transposase